MKKCPEILSRYDINSQKMKRGLKFRIKEVEGKQRRLSSCEVAAIFTYFLYKNSIFFHDAAYLFSGDSKATTHNILETSRFVLQQDRCVILF